MTTWHAHDELLSRYARGHVDDVVAASIEAHVVACAECRDRIAIHVSPSRLQTNWDSVAIALDAPVPGPLERLIRWCGVRESTARLLAATPTLRMSWLASIVLAAAFAAIAGTRPGGAPVLFLALAPLVPVAAVAIAFSPSLDPSSELTSATPVAGLRLLLLRAVAALGPSIVLAGATGALVGGVGGSWAVWLLPALALSALSLALAPAVPVGIVAPVLGGLWAIGAIVAEAEARGSVAAVRAGGDPESFLVLLPAQVLAGAVALVAATVTTRQTLLLGETRRRHQ